jgi:hypothetical protein
MSQSISRLNQRCTTIRKPWRSTAILRAVALAAAASIICGQAFAAKPKPKPAPKPEPAKESPATDTPGPALPDDLNLASLRVKALDLLYELDLSNEQLKDLRVAASGTGSTQHRAAAKGSEKLATKLREFQGAVLEKKEGSQIDTMRNAIADLADSVQLDDGVQITAAARAKSANVVKQLRASQIAAFLAAHADEVGDPVEMMIGATEQLRESRANAPAATDDAAKAATGDKSADKSSDAASETAGLVQETSADVGELIAGLDEAKAKSLATDVAKWINANSSLKDDEFAAKRKALEEDARRVVGNIHPMRVLNNWLEQQMASLLSNPQLPGAIDAILQVKQRAD